MFTNKRLLEVLTRHQIYVESVKQGIQQNFSLVLNEINKEVSILLSKVQFKTLDGLTKAELTKLLSELKQSQSVIYGKYTKSLVEQLQSFMKADIKVGKILVSSVKLESEDEDEEEIVTENEADDILEGAEENENNNLLLPLFWLKSEDNGGEPDKIWSNITNAPVPANGILPLIFWSQFVASASAAIENEIRKGYANKAEIAAVLKAIKGSKNLNYRDGLLNKLYNQSGAVTDTNIQHISSIVQAAVQSVFFQKYQWISVIDSRTTEICRSRNLKIYIYGKGPLPPAHIRCRSKTKPVVYGDAQTAEQTYYEFMKVQPKAFQDDILGKLKAEALRKGILKPEDMPQFSNPKPLTIAEFLNRIKSMLSR